MSSRCKNIIYRIVYIIFECYHYQVKSEYITINTRRHNFFLGRGNIQGVKFYE